jgi:hypothetical protein
MDPVYSIKSEDLHYVFLGLEDIALIIFVLVLTLYAAARLNPLKGAYEKVVMGAAILLVVGLAGAYATSLFNYLHYVRPAYVRVNSQIRHDRTGL